MRQRLAAAIAIGAGAIPFVGSGAVMAIGAGWLFGKIYESAFDSAVGIGEWAGQELYDRRHGTDPNSFGSPPDRMNQIWRDAANWQPPRDPLSIDLDGDGIETLGITKTPILFDRDADRIRTGTGWLSGDDGWLVLDRNGDGHIDSGRELFGEDTLITDADGHARHARSGLRVRGSRAAQNC